MGMSFAMGSCGAAGNGLARDDPGLGTLLREWRQRALLTQEQLAERTGLNVRTVRGLESGSPRRPRTASVQLLAEALGLDTAERAALVSAARSAPAQDGSVSGPAVDAHSEPAAAASSVPLIPKQLPAEVADFTGRDVHIITLRDFLRPRALGRRGSVAVATITGPGGIGKSALSVHLAHELAEAFPDGQLYASLGGASRPLRPADVLAVFLRDLGLPDSAIPVGEAERAARYRSLLADRSMLIVLDDVEASAQVRPLLPGTARSAVIVTSRNGLPGLAGAKPVELEVLNPEESRRLFAAIVGDQRTDAEPDGTAGVIASCAGLPLAIRIAGSRLTSRPGWSVAQLSEMLADERQRLAALTVGDLAVRASFSASYRALSPADQAPARVFRLIGLAGLPAICLPAAAALTGQPVDEAATALQILTDAHLLQSPEPDRFRMHDLIRLYAAELSASEETAQSRNEALHRLLTWYLHSVDAGVRLLDSGRRRFPLEAPATGTTPLSFSSRRDALAWLETERTSFPHALRLATDSGMPQICWELAILLREFTDWAGYFHDEITISQTGLAAAERTGHQAAVAALLNSLGSAHLSLWQRPTAAGYYERAIDISQAIGDEHTESMALSNLGQVDLDSGHYNASIERFLQALAIDRRIGRRMGEGFNLHNLGTAHVGLGELDLALRFYQDALIIRQESGTAGNQAATLHSIGDTLLTMGRHAEADEYLSHGLRLCRENGILYGEGMMLASLGVTRHATGQVDEARSLWQSALEILASIGVPEANSMRQRLDAESA
jgi:tetratricopeptide (TPR) repeat protein/transcriptional regulator with XRE-family HTH domain